MPNRDLSLDLLCHMIRIWNKVGWFYTCQEALSLLQATSSWDVTNEQGVSLVFHLFGAVHSSIYMFHDVCRRNKFPITNKVIYICWLEASGDSLAYFI